MPGPGVALKGFLVLTPDDICDAIKEYYVNHGLPGVVVDVALSGDGKTSARVTIEARGGEPAVLPRKYDPT